MCGVLIDADRERGTSARDANRSDRVLSGRRGFHPRDLDACLGVSAPSQFGRSAASLKLAVKMNNRIKIAFLTMISLQAVHSVEEYIFKFYEAFPPMQFIYRDAPDLAKSGFVTFNLLLFLFGIICFFYWVQPARKGARVVIWVWIAIQLATIASHAIWVMSVGDYHPGLATVPLFVPIVVFMMYLLHYAPTKPPPNKSLDARRKQ